MNRVGFTTWEQAMQDAHKRAKEWQSRSMVLGHRHDGERWCYHATDAGWSMCLVVRAQRPEDRL